MKLYVSLFRLKEKYHRPAVAFARAEDGSLKGSSRSIPGLHIRDAIDAVATQNLDHVFIPYHSRRSLFLAILRARQVLKSQDVQVVHGHGIEGTMIGLVAALTVGIRERIHTRHHATMHHEGGPRHGVIADRVMNYLSYLL